MDNEILRQPTPPQYRQPDCFSVRRVLHDTLEDVDYLPQAHLRIWYNNEQGVYDTHHHSAMEVLLCLEDETVVFAQETTYRLRPGDILLIPPHMLHKLVLERFGARFIFLLDLEPLQSYRDLKLLDPLLMQPFLCTASRCPQSYRPVYDNLLRMTELYFAQDAFWEMQVYALLLDTLCRIARSYFSGSGPDAEAQDRAYFDKFSDLIRYIDAHYSQDLTLDQAARYLGFSKFHFARLFKVYANTTFYHYLCHKRIQAAQELLSTGASVTEIALRTGFNNPTSFCRCFKRFTRCSPSEYRARLSEAGPDPSG